MTNKSKRRDRSRQNRRAREGASLESVFFTSGRKRRHRSGIDTKSLQLCRQVHRRLDLALTELEDPLLSGLWVRAVIPEPGGRSLIVELSSTEDVPIRDLLVRLDAVRGRLRADIAAAIHRKRTPYLQFMIVPPNSDQDALDARSDGDPLDEEEPR